MIHSRNVGVSGGNRACGCCSWFPGRWLSQLSGPCPGAQTPKILGSGNPPHSRELGETTGPERLGGDSLRLTA